MARRLLAPLLVWNNWRDMREQTLVPDLYLEFCSSSDVVEIEKRHYVEKMPAVADRLTPASK